MLPKPSVPINNPIPNNFPDDTISTATPLARFPSIDLGNGPTITVRGSVGLTDPDDYYSFTLNETRYVHLKLDNLTERADLELIKDSNKNGQTDAGEVLADSFQPGTNPELISKRLEAGMYLIRVRVYPFITQQVTPYTLTYSSRLRNVQPDNGPQPFGEVQPVTPKIDGVYFSDVTGDGKDDGTVVNNWGTTTRRSNGTWLTENEEWTTDPYFGSKRTYFADVDADGKADAIVANEDGVFVRRSDGSKFGSYQKWTSIGYFGDKGTFFADVTGDGKADAIVVNAINNVGIVVRRSDGTQFKPNEWLAYENYGGARGFYFADVNGDGKADAIIAENDGLKVRLSDGTKFLSAQNWTGIDYSGTKGLFFADATGDGMADAIVVNTPNERGLPVGITVRRSDGTRFTNNETWSTNGSPGDKGVYFADVNGDGKADVIYSNNDGVKVGLSDGSKFGDSKAWTESGYWGNGGHGTLVRSLDASDPKAYLIEGNQRRWIPNAETFIAMGFEVKNVQFLSNEDLNGIPLGKDLPSRKDGALVQGSGAAVYIMESGKRRWIPNAETFIALKLNANAIQYISDEDLKAIPLGAG